MNKKTPIVISIVAVAVIIVAVIIFSGGQDEDTTDKSVSNISDSIVIDDGFTGDRGETLKANGEVVQVAESDVDDGNMHAYNYFSEEKDKTVYFFIVKASDGTYRVAANACEVCHDTKKGFSQVGDKIKCNNCGKVYSKETIAKQKGGCNPRPIDADAPVNDGQLEIALQDIEEASELF